MLTSDEAVHGRHPSGAPLLVSADMHDYLAGGGEMGTLMRSMDWSKTALGPIDSWPQSLRTCVSLCLTSRFPIVIFWGPELVLLYNGAYLPILGGKHPRSLGQSGLETWAEIRGVIEPMLRAVMATGEATWSEDLMLPIVRDERADESYFTFTYSPIRDESGGVGGVFCAVVETTEKVIEERRLRLLNALAAVTRTRSPAEACAFAGAQIERFQNDVPFALLYLNDDAASVASLAGTANIGAGAHLSPTSIRRGDHSVWPFDESGNQHVRFVELAETHPGGARGAMVLPIERSGGGRPFGFIVVGLSPMLRKSDSYDRFHNLLAASVSQAVGNAAAYAEERKRAELLAEIDRAKTAFFSNVSHEFRTPLTLMLGPTEDALSSPERALRGDALETVHRNELRLLKLVNALLDFARIEAGRMQASYEPTDLSALTADLASSFRSAMARAGLSFEIDCPPLPEPIYVDRDMWEKIVLNLLSNALKFTFEGAIVVTLRALEGHVELTVRDTGVGIAESELPRLFERFHRIQGARARTHEGSGIGLALVQELVRMHGGSIRATSEPARGTTFFVRIMCGREHVPAEWIDTQASLSSKSHGAGPFVEEALRWIPSDKTPSTPPLDTVSPVPAIAEEPRGRVIVADDNADMRDYVARLLSGRYDVETAADGAEALRAAKSKPPDLVLADVMMPNMDGFELVRALRADVDTRGIPILLVSARAGDEATTEGLDSGADDYIVKPFSSRELVARVDAHVVRGRMRAAETAHRKYLSTVFENAPVGIAILHGAEHVYTFVNARYMDLTPHKRADELLGRAIRDALPEVAGQGIIEILDNVYRTGEPFVGRSFLAKLARGEAGALVDVFFDFVYQPVRASNGAIEGIIVVGYDVTDLTKARREAEAANRAKDEFLAMLGHELRNPLAPIVTALELMNLRGTAPRERTIIDRQVRHLRRLVDDLLDVSRIARDKITLAKEDLDVAGIIADAIETATPILEQHAHRLRVKVPATTYFVHGDRLRLAQGISNLLTNAAKYTDAGGTIEVTATDNAGSVVIAVRDNGRGIDPELLPRVFDLFEQGARTIDRSQGGLGLGLAIVKNLVALHGGAVSAASDGVGRGSVFTVRLPLLDRAAQVETKRFEHPPTVAPTGLRVLIVDDNQDAADMLDEALRLMGHTTRVAYDGPEALLAASEFKPEIALVDIGLPVMDGYEVAQKLREMLDGGPELIAITGYGQESDRVKARAAGFNAHLVKPVEMAELARLLVRRP